MPIPKIEANDLNITEKATCIVIDRKYIGTSKAVPKDKVKVIGETETKQTDAKWWSSSKTLIASDELTAIYNADAGIDQLLQYYCLPSLFKRSMYLLPYALVPEVDEILLEHEKRRQGLVDEFIKVYDLAITEAAGRLGDLFDPSDYVTSEVARASFQYSWKYVEFGVSSGLKNVSAEMYKREQEKAQAQWVEASDSIRQLLRAGMAELVNHMAERLSPTADGKKRVFRASSLENLDGFIATFDARNLTNDTELRNLVEKVKALTEGLDPEVLRSDDNLRANMQKSFEAVKTDLDKLVVDAPTRRIELE